MKKYKIIFSPGALLDLKEAKQWYNKQQKELGKRLVADVKLTTSAIANSPYHTSEKYPPVRVAYCKVFPYGVHYKVNKEENTVFITSIFHFSRKPFWIED